MGTSHWHAARRAYPHAARHPPHATRCVTIMRLHSNLGQLASQDVLRAGSGGSLITEHNLSSTAAFGYGPRSESGHHGRTERTARIGAVTSDVVNRFYSAIFERINGHRKSCKLKAQQ